MRKLLPPYIALDFDNKGAPEVTATIGELQSLMHLASYGRPLYAALILCGKMLLITLGGGHIYLKSSRMM